MFIQYVVPGGPMECDKVLTECFNEFVQEHGFALKTKMPVTIQPLTKHWLPSLVLQPELECEPSWIEEDGTVNIQQPSSPYSSLEIITKLLNWFYSNSVPSPDDLGHWSKGQLCIGM